MTDDARTFRLGILGGCLTHQPGIPLSALFHRQLARSLLSRSPIRVRVSMGRLFEGSYLARWSNLREQGPFDGLLVHVRNDLIKKAGLLCMTPAGVGRRYVWHPFLFNRRGSGADWGSHVSARPDARGIAHRSDATALPYGQPPPGRRVAGFRLRELNHLAGWGVGLSRWACEDEWKLLHPLLDQCQREACPLIIMGPTPYDRMPGKNLVCTMMDRLLRKRLALRGIPYCSLMELAREPSCFQPDGWHLTVHGHARVSARLLTAVESIVQRAGVPRL